MQTDRPPIPVVLLTGFLGSGKTTLLKRLLKRLPLTAVVMNEFGEVALDHRLLEEMPAALALLSGGCVCCQIQGSLAPTLKNLWMARERGELPAYERLIVETTGIADPASVIATLVQDRWLAARHRLDGIVTTVDGVFGEQQLAEHFEAQRQVAVADRLLLTKTDLAEGAAIEALRARLAALNPAAPLLEVVHGAVDPQDILGGGLLKTGGEPPEVPRWLAADRYPPAAPSHTGRICAFSLSFEEPLVWEDVVAALETLTAIRARGLLRMKAILNLAGQPSPTVLHAIQHVAHSPARLAAWPDEDRRSRFVFIVCDVDAGFVAKLLADFTAVARQHYFTSASVA